MKSFGFALLIVLTAAAVDAATVSLARERISCTARDGCMFGKSARKPIAGWNCHSRRSHIRSYYFCTPGSQTS